MSQVLISLLITMNQIFLANNKRTISRFFERVALTIQPGFYLFKVNNRSTKNTRAKCEMCLKLIVETPERQWYHSGVFIVKGAVTGLRQFLETESPLKMMKNTFYFTSKTLFVLKIFNFLSWLFSHVAKGLDKKDKVNFKFYDIIAWLTNNRNTHIVQYLEK